MSETGAIRGFKVFNHDWTCRDKQYTCPGVFEEDVTPSVCNRGMHFCKRASDCFNYYSFNPENKVAEVIALTDCTVEDGDKCATKHLEIVREIPWAELLEIVNVGKACSGLCNSGNYNSGNRNSGNHNSGYGNSGDCNSGNYNSGDYNKCSFSNGCFNTVEPKIYMFNKPSEWTYRDWLNSEARYLLNQIPSDILEYVWFEDMTSEEKAAHPEAEVTGGYLKQIDNSECGFIWWHELSDYKKRIIKTIPNFDKEIFKEITGIDVDME
ncbi:MAG: pentapeptide repeat-containing protein [Candidatus Limousia pullorum]|nr:pentapeptide repeat-containing protein [Candidatus Limousia pullorum]